MCIESQVPASASNPHPLSTQHPALSTQHSTKKREISQYHRGDSREIRGLTGRRFGGAFLSTQNSQPHQIQPLTNFPHFQSVFFRAPSKPPPNSSSNAWHRPFPPLKFHRVVARPKLQHK